MLVLASDPVHGYGSITNNIAATANNNSGGGIGKYQDQYTNNKRRKRSCNNKQRHHQHESIQYLNQNEEDEMEIYGYEPNYFCTLLTWLAIVATLSLLRLVFFWKPHWMLYCTYRRCSLLKATKVLLIDKYNQYFVEKICSLEGGFSSSTTTSKSASLEQQEYNKQPTPQLNDDAYNSTDILPDFDSVSYESCAISGQSKTRHHHHHHHLCCGDTTDTGAMKFFENKKLRYVWDKQKETFVKLYGLDKGVSLSKLLRQSDGLSMEEQELKRRLYGDNAIHVEVQSYFKILVEEVLGPFYIFQLFSITIWFLDDYYYYGACIIVMSILSLVSGVVQIRKNQQQLRDTVESVDYVKVCRGNNQYEEIESSRIVPGDIVVIPTFDAVLQFDAILLNGNVIVNESMLTGESVPITKTPLTLSLINHHHHQPHPPHQHHHHQHHHHSSSATSEPLAGDCYDPKEHGKHTLFCGTKVLQTRYYGGAHVRALVIRVGFQTTKGELIRSIMFPKPVDFRFNKQIHRFIGLLACLALMGFLYTVILKTSRGASFHSIVIGALDLITITVPPALPAAMTIGIIYAQSRLKKRKIYCISPRSINISGCINCVCFDKTGTLTEDHLSFNEVVPVIEDKCQFSEPIDQSAINQSSSSSSSSVPIVRHPHQNDPARQFNVRNEIGDYTPLIVCLASCHSLTIIDQKLIGDPLDLQMFEATGWTLEEPDVDDENKFDLLAPSIVKPPRKSSGTTAVLSASSASNSSSEEDLANIKRSGQDVGILRQFPFSSSLQRMSIITRRFGANQFVVYSKGAPEKIASLCDPDTVPDDFSDVLMKYTRKGFRVLALAYRPLPAGLSYPKMQRATRNDIEKNLKFLGFLTLGNKLKPETTGVIKILNDANIRSVMVTGDNILTAISVAKECRMISPQDRVALLQVDKKDLKNRKLLQQKQQQQSAVTNSLQQSMEQSLIGDSSVVLSVKDIEIKLMASVHQPLQSANNNSTDDNNISLSSYNNSNKIVAAVATGPRPRLTWHYISQDGDDQDDNDDTNRPMYYNEGLVSIRFRDSDRIHLALSGETWEIVRDHYPELLDAVCVRGTVFARMAPDQKQQLVEHLQKMQYYVSMCGDGANDSGALRAAHTGISLSDTEASVAAPFTSANANISCVPILISEGRTALVTAFGILKYMALYSLIQFCSVIILYTLYSNLTDMEFLYEDLFIITLFVALFSRTEPHTSLDKKPPSSSLLSFTQISSVAIQLVLVVFFQLLACVLLWQQDWYKAHDPEYDKELVDHDNYAVFGVSVFQYITLAIVFSKGKPYRKPIYTNYLFIIALLLMTILTTIILIIPAEWNVPFISLEVTGVPLKFRVLIIGIALVQYIVSMIGERFIVDHLIFKKSKKFFEAFGSKPNGTIFEIVDRETQSMRWLSGCASEIS